MKVVLDTNILVRSVSPKPGLASEIIRLLLDDDHHVLVLSVPMLVEASRVLRYERMRKLHGLSEAELDRRIEFFQSASMIVVPAHLSSPVSSDPDDDVIIATAVAGSANAIATLDAHLHEPTVKEFCSHMEIQVLSDVELVNHLRAAR